MMGKWLARQNTPQPEILLQSNFQRSKSTAKRMGKQLDLEPITCGWLDPENDPELIWPRIKALAKERDAQSVLAISHGPLVERLFAYLTGAKAEQLHFAHGAIAHFDDTPSSTTLRPFREALPPKKKLLAVAAFASILATGELADPEDVNEGDDLYRADQYDPGAGTISKDSSGFKIGAALAFLAAGMKDKIHVSVPMKEWVLGGGGLSGNCEDCEGNADQGPISAEEEFDSGDLEPPAHPNCTCSLDISEMSEAASPIPSKAVLHWMVSPNTVARDEDEMENVTSDTLRTVEAAIQAVTLALEDSDLVTA